MSGMFWLRQEDTQDTQFEELALEEVIVLLKINLFCYYLKTIHAQYKVFNITERVTVKNVSYYPDLQSPSPFPQMHSLLPFIYFQIFFYTYTSIFVYKHFKTHGI